MAKGKNQHVTPAGKKWQVKGAGNEKATKVTTTQKQAIDAGRKTAQNQQAELVIHDKHGKIRDKESYGNDQCPPKDTK